MNELTKWTIDPSHSEITFKVKHLMITNVKGEFKNFSGEVNSIGNGFLADSINFTIEAGSIFTNSNDRDAHLKSADFFDADKYKQLTFQGISLDKVNEDSFKLTGIFTMRNVSKEITLDVEYGGINTDPWGNEKAGFSFSGKINRKDWGLNWNATLESGGVLVSEEVKLSGELQFVKQAVEAVV